MSRMLFTLVTICMAICTVLGATRHGFAAEAMDVGDRVCLFLDDHYIAEQSGLKRTWHQGEPADAPAITADAKAGEDWPHLFGSVFFDPQDKLYKMFYESVAHGRGWLRYAESSDGKTWNKPALRYVELNGSRENNIVFPHAELPNVFIDPLATEPKSRIKIIAWCAPQEFKGKKVGGLYHFQSSDGRDWEPVGGISVSAPADDTAKARTVLDTNVIAWDRRKRHYYGTFRSFPTHPGLPGFARDAQYQTTYGVVGGHRRAVAISTSKEIHSGWPPSQNALRPDAKDDEKAARLSKDPTKPDYCELYIMPTFNYGNHYLGMVSLLFFVDGSDTERGGGDVQYTFSHDCHSWHRQPDRQTFVKPNPTGLVPTYAQFNEPLVIGKRMWIYYSEADSAHPRAGDTSQIRAASWRKDGFVSLDATEKLGSLTTHPLLFDGAKLLVNAKLEDGGSLRIALLDEAGKAIPGYDLADCETIRGDHVAKEVNWRNSSDVSAWFSKPVRLKFELSLGSLYSFCTSR